MPWHRGSGCLGAAAPVTGAAADEYNLNVVDCNTSVTVARRSISVSRGLGVVCLLLKDLLQSCARGGRRIVEDMCCEIRRAEACVD